MTKDEAQTALDQLDREISELYQELRDKESERAKLNRIANPEDYE